MFVLIQQKEHPSNNSRNKKNTIHYKFNSDAKLASKHLK